MLTKVAVYAQARASLRRALEASAAAAALARSAATDDQAVPENKYDTRALEASYLAAGQGARLQELRDLLGWLENYDETQIDERVRLGSLVQVEVDGERERWLLLVPRASSAVFIGDHEVALISPRSQFGGSLLGLEVEEEVEIDTPRGRRAVSVLALS